MICTPTDSFIISRCKQRRYINLSTTWHIITYSKGSGRSIKLLALRGLCILSKWESLPEIIKQLFPGRMNCCGLGPEESKLISPLGKHNSDSCFTARLVVFIYLSVKAIGDFSAAISAGPEEPKQTVRQIIRELLSEFPAECFHLKMPLCSCIH